MAEVDIVFPGNQYTGSNPLYFVAYSLTSGQYVNASSVAMEVYNAAHWSQYAVSLPLDPITTDYDAAFPDVPNDSYFVTIYARIGSAPATTDQILSEGDFLWQPIGPSGFIQQMQADAAALFDPNEFAELVTYTPYGGTATPMYAIIDRSALPQTIHETESKVLAESLKVIIQNSAEEGITGWTRKDTIGLPVIYGTAPTTHLVTGVLNSDPMAFVLRIR